MNRKKIIALILAFLVSSSMLPKVQTSAEITNDTAKDYILSQNYIREKPEEITSLTSKDSSKVDISDVTGENDFASYFVLSHSNNFVEVNKMSSEKIIPVIDLSKLSLIGLETINYEITKTNKSTKAVTKEKFSYSGVKSKVYKLPDIVTTDLESVTITYNVLGLLGQEKKSKKIIYEDFVAPKLSIKNLQYTLAPESSSMNLKFNVEAQNDSLIPEKSAIYLNDALINDTKINYDEINKVYNVSLNIPKWNSNLNIDTIDFFAADEAYNIGKASIKNFPLVNFDNWYDKKVIADKDLKVTGSLGSGITSLKVDEQAAVIDKGKFIGKVNSSQGTLTAEYSYNGLPIIFIADYVKDDKGPTFNSVTVNSYKVENQGILYIKSPDNLIIKGTLSDNYLTKYISLKSVSYTLKNGWIKKLDLSSLANEGKYTINNGSFNLDFNLENINNNDLSTITLIAQDNLANESEAFSFNILVDTVSPEVSIGTGSSQTDFKPFNDGISSKSPFTPCIKVTDENLDEDTSTIEVKAEGESMLPSDSFTTTLKDDTKFIKSNNYYSFKTPLMKDGNYTIIANIKDKSGNTASYTVNFSVDNENPLIKISGLEKFTFPDYAANVDLVTPRVVISDINKDSASITVVKDNEEGPVYENPKAYEENPITLPSADGKTLEGTYTLTVNAKDKAGNSSADSFTFTVDRTSPVIEGIYIENDGNYKDKNLDNEEYYRHYFNPSVAVKENNIDKQNSKFIVNNKAYSFGHANVEFIKGRYVLKNVINEDGIYNLKVHVEDTAGNTTSDISREFYVDTDIAKVSIINDFKNGYLQSLTPILQIDDQFLKKEDLKSEEYIIASLYTIDVTTNLYKSKKDYGFEFKSKVGKTITLQGTDYIPSNNPGEKYMLEVLIKDKAGKGNKEDYIKETKFFYIDNIKPNANFLNINHGTYYRNPEDPSVIITEQHLDKDNSFFTVNNEIYNFNHSNVVYDDGKYTLKNVVTKNGKPIDGTYNIKLHLQDLAGNEFNLDEVTIYVDSKVPELSIGNINNGAYYNSKVTPEFLIEDDFLSKQDIDKGELINATLYTINSETKATITSKPYKLEYIDRLQGKLLIRGESIENNNLRNEQYKIVVQFKDKASKHNNEDYKTSAVEFVIDKNNPNISFSEANGRIIENGSYYQGTFNPIIKISDNYAINTKSITLNGNPYGGNFITTEDGILFQGAEINSDGNYTISVMAEDKATNKAKPFEINFTLDNTKPAIEISGVKDDEFNNKEITTPIIKIIDTNNALNKTVFKLSKNGGAFNTINPSLYNGVFSFNVSEEGEYKLLVTAEDLAGNSYTAPILTFTIDRTKPIVKINAEEGAFINTNNFKPLITTQVPEDTVFEVFINDTYYNPNSLPMLPDGEYTVRARAKDKAGNISEETKVSFILDRLPPQIFIQGLEGLIFHKDDIKLSIRQDELYESIFEVYLNGKRQSANSISINSEGEYILKVLAVDKANNTNERTVKFVLDKTKPIIEFKEQINNRFFREFIEPIFDIIDSSDHKYTITIDNLPYVRGSLLADGKHTLIIEATDAAGNVSDPKVITFFIDSTPPTILFGGIEDGEKYTASVKPEIYLEDLSDITTPTVLLNGKQVYANSLDGKTFLLEEITSLGNHELTVKATDKLGNETTKTINFTITGNKSAASLLGKNKVILTTSAVSIIAIILGLFAFLKLRKKPEDSSRDTE